MSEVGFRPLRDLLYVKRHKEEKSAGGIHLLHGWRARRSPRQTMAAQPDLWPAQVIAVGPDVRDVEPGDEIYVFTFRDEQGKNPTDTMIREDRTPERYRGSSGLFTGEPGPHRDCFFIEERDHLGVLVERHPDEPFLPIYDGDMP